MNVVVGNSKQLLSNPNQPCGRASIAFLGLLVRRDARGDCDLDNGPWEAPIRWKGRAEWRTSMSARCVTISILSDDELHDTSSPIESGDLKPHVGDRSRGAKSSNEKEESHVERLWLVLDRNDVEWGVWAIMASFSTDKWDSKKGVEWSGWTSKDDGRVGEEECRSLTKSSPESIVGSRETCRRTMLEPELDARVRDVIDALKARQLSWTLRCAAALQPVKHFWNKAKSWARCRDDTGRVTLVPAHLKQRAVVLSSCGREWRYNFLLTSAGTA